MVALTFTELNSALHSLFSVTKSSWYQFIINVVYLTLDIMSNKGQGNSKNIQFATIQTAKSFYLTVAYVMKYSASFLLTI